MLIGDAGHLTNPTGGLGLTPGLYDVLALEELLPAVACGEADESILDRRAQDRARVFREITWTLDGRQTMLMGLDSPVVLLCLPTRIDDDHDSVWSKP